MLDMKSNDKKKKRSSRNLKISTRITLATIFGVVIPLLIIGIFSTLFINSMSSYFNFSTVSSNTYSVINQIQWDQTLSNIATELINENSDEESMPKIKKLVAPLEKLGSIIYIENDKGEFYSTSSKQEVLDTANGIIEVDTEKNTNFFSEDGVVIVNHVNAVDNTYLILIANNNYKVADIFEENVMENFNVKFFGRTSFILALIALIFILSAVVLSLIASSTIIKPIRKLEEGANEIANGNLDYVIDYNSTNEIGVTVDAFNGMTQRLKSSMEYMNKIEEDRKQVIAGVAHDLRTPLTSIKGYVEGLMDGIADTPEKQERYLKTIYKSTTSMERLLDELLTVSKLETGKIELDLHEVSINEFLEDCFINTQIAVESHGAEYTLNNNCSPDTMVMLDSDQFERVIKNILSNSVRYQKKGVKSKIEISAHEYNKDVIISISDNGIGMSSENIPKIFDSFYRADLARTKVSEGSGLGLYVCKQIVELHDGRIWATGKEGEGLTMHISLKKITKTERQY